MTSYVQGSFKQCGTLGVIVVQSNIRVATGPLLNFQLDKSANNRGLDVSVERVFFSALALKGCMHLVSAHFQVLYKPHPHRSISPNKSFRISSTPKEGAFDVDVVRLRIIFHKWGCNIVRIG